MIVLSFKYYFFTLEVLHDTTIYTDLKTVKFKNYIHTHVCFYTGYFKINVTNFGMLTLSRWLKKNVNHWA